MTDPKSPEPQRFPLGDALGLELDTPEEGIALGTVHTTANHLNPHGAVHGAVVFTLVDTAMGAATMSVLPEDQMCVSIDVHMRFVRPVFGGTIHCETRVVHPGRRIVQLTSTVTGDEEKVVATATGAFAVIPRP